jgi:hypothetical protein
MNNVSMDLDEQRRNSEWKAELEDVGYEAIKLREIYSTARPSILN